MVKPMGLLVAGFNYVNAAEDEFNDWYDTEHIPERLRIKGFVNAQRWLGADDPKVSIATYDLETLDVLKSPPYLAISGQNSSPWSKRIIAKLERICRVEAEQILPGSKAALDNAGGLLLCAMNVAPEGESEFNEWYSTEYILQLSAVPGCLCVRRFKANGGSHRYFALYELAGPEVVGSKAWAQVAATPGTLSSSVHKFGNVLCQAARGRGEGNGGANFLISLARSSRVNCQSKGVAMRS